MTSLFIPVWSRVEILQVGHITVTHGVLPSLNYRGDFLILKKCFDRNWSFFHFSGGMEGEGGGGRVHMRRLTKIGCEGGGDSTLKI